MVDPSLHRALRHLGAGHWAEEADSGTVICAAARASEALAFSAGRVDCLHRRSRLEYSIKTGDARRVAWLLDRAHFEALAWGAPPAPARLTPRWKLALFERPPLDGEFFFAGRSEDWPRWPVPATHGAARAALLARAGGAPHDGFVMPPQVGYPHGFGSRIDGPLAAWRAAHPGALVANLHARSDLVDADFAHLVGVKALRITECGPSALTSAAFAHLRGVHTLWMGGCHQASLGDAAFAHLRGVHTLNMAICTQATLTDGAFVHLRGVQTLDMSGCTQPPITGATLSQLRGVRLLDMNDCRPAVIAAARALRLPLAAMN